MMGICVLSKLDSTGMSLYWSSGEPVFVFLLGVYLGMELLGHRICIYCEALRDTTKSLLTTWVYPPL